MQTQNILESVIEIDVIQIVPSPFQPRQYFDQSRLQDLADNIKAYGLIHPIVTRRVNEHFELLAGERRWRATKLIPCATIRAEIRQVDDQTAQGIVLSENLKRDDLTAIERVCSTARWVDFALSADPDYQALHVPERLSFEAANKDAANLRKLVFLLMKLDGDHKNNTDYFRHKFVSKIEFAFASLPEPVEWRSFFVHDLQPYTKMPEDVIEIAISQKLNKSQAKALTEIKRDAPEIFREIKETGTAEVRTDELKLEKVSLPDVSARELKSRVREVKTIQRLKNQLEQRKLSFHEKYLSLERRPLIVHGDCLQWMLNLEDNSFDLLFTDPPYATDVDDIQGFVNQWLPLALSKVKPTGRAYICTGAYPVEQHAYLAYLLQQDKFCVDTPLVWTYKNTIGPDTKLTYKLNYQVIFHLYGKDALPLNSESLLEKFSVQEINAPDGRIGNRVHPWQKPDELAEQYFRHATKEGNSFFDPFAGTGTFLVVGNTLKRIGIGCEKNRETVELALSRGCQEDKADAF